MPIHAVSMPSFHLGKYPVTQQQWKAIMQHNLSAHKGDDLPVENVSWLDANEFCARLSLVTGRCYRLPSEAEWEYACRARTTTHYSFGDDISPLVANYWDIEDVEQQSSIELKTTRVGTFYPNDFGLYDVHGNVYELCGDTWRWNYTGAPTDGGPWLYEEAPELVVIRGGSCDYYADNCRCAYRTETMPDYRYSGTGFRVACSISKPE
ncbi:MAG: formylglycine-generating enzyme family protein [Phormidesmis sp.]